MGVIKKLKGKDLVGWQLNPGVDVYPITHIGAVFNDLNVSLSDILDGLQLQISGGSGGGSSASTYPINYLWAYTTARTDSEALSKLDRSELVNIPTNFVGNTSFTVSDGYYIYMTTARNQGGVYLRWEDNSIWSIPVRIGSGYTTSYTGNDGEGYNYVYCRTNNATPPNIPASLTVVRLEGLSDNQGISASDGSVSQALYNVWYDHPLGVDGTYQWEWIAISRGNDGTGWSAYTGPTLWSKFGIDGKDGDGVEYIYTITTDTSPAPLFINTYNGRIGEQGTDFRDVLIENCTSDSFYQQDDFIPSGWHDTPQVISLEYNKQYVSIRKKRFTNENEGYWGPFSLPVLWASTTTLGLRGAVVRSRGEWTEGVTYCYNTDMEGNGPSENNIVYIDIVYYNGNYYQCALHHTSTSSRTPENTLYWTVALNFEFIATKVLVADAADILVLSGGSAVVKDDSLTIVGGMTGGTLAATNDVIIWAGSTLNNISNAKFKVYENGLVELNDVVAHGSMRTPFIGMPADAWSDDILQQRERSDCMTVESGSYSTVYPLPLSTPSNSGRIITVINKSQYTATLSTGGFSEVTSYIYEEGESPTTDLDLSGNSMVQLLGFGTSSTFYGWLVINRKTYNFGSLFTS